MNTFSWKAYGDRKVTTTALNTRVEFQNNSEQVQQTAIHPKVIFERTYSGSHDEMLALKAFHDAHAPGGVLFYWTDEDGTQHTVRFATDSCEINQKYGLGDNGFGVQAYTTTLQFRKVWQ